MLVHSHFCPPQSENLPHCASRSLGEVYVDIPVHIFDHHGLPPSISTYPFTSFPLHLSLSPRIQSYSERLRLKPCQLTESGRSAQQSVQPFQNPTSRFLALPHRADYSPGATTSQLCIYVHLLLHPFVHAVIAPTTTTASTINPMRNRERQADHHTEKQNPQSQTHSHEPSILYVQSPVTPPTPLYPPKT
jgi:hypothetical protein